MALTLEQLCHHYSLADIRVATAEFNENSLLVKEVLERSTKEYQERKSSSIVVAIKRLDSMSDQGAPEFRAEIEMLSRLRHSHLVSLLGCCVDGKEMILVYEFMPHGMELYMIMCTEVKHLSETKDKHRGCMRIGLSSHWCRDQTWSHTHHDVKSSNILLDEDWAAKISDFRLAKICPINQLSTYIHTAIKGTFGYMDPEIFMTGKFTRKTDVFAFWEACSPPRW